MFPPILVPGQDVFTCSVCRGTVNRMDRRLWRNADISIQMSAPPDDLHNSVICTSCYCVKNGPVMEDLIRKAMCEPANVPRVTMPDGSDGLNCSRCGEYCSYVEPNDPSGYVCRKHRS